MPRVAVKDAKGKGKVEGKGGSTKGNYLSFEVARAIVRNLKLKSKKEGCVWSKSGQRPSNIPGTPSRTYRDDGWISWPDWLGKEGGRGAMLPFAVARAIVRKLKLKSHKEWVAWSKSGPRRRLDLLAGLARQWEAI